jgi:hypothetical protein
VNLETEIELVAIRKQLNAIVGNIFLLSMTILSSTLIALKATEQLNAAWYAVTAPIWFPFTLAFIVGVLKSVK